MPMHVGMAMSCSVCWARVFLMVLMSKDGRPQGAGLVRLVWRGQLHARMVSMRVHAGPSAVTINICMGGSSQARMGESGGF